MAQPVRDRRWRRWKDSIYVARRIRMINYLWFPRIKIRLQLMKDCKTCQFKWRCLVEEGPYYGYQKCAKKIDWLKPNRYRKYNLKCTCTRCQDERAYKKKGRRKKEYQELQKQLRGD